jgi:GNAT superfamily N-acetyltransferase
VGLRQFIRLPRALYRDDANWPPPIELERRAFLNPRKHPFFRHGAAQAFTAWRGGECVGRILTADDPRFNELHSAKTGTFGLFESINDREVAGALLETAAEWLRGRGLKTLLGPIDYSTNYPCGLLVEGFGTTPSILLNYNPPFYGPLLEGWGLRKAKDLFSFWYHTSQGVPKRWLRLAERARKRNRVTVRPINVRDFDAELARIETIYNGAWQKNWAAVPMTHAEFEHLGREVKPLLIEGLVVIAEVDQEPVGFSLSLPDINPMLQKIDGRLLPFGALRLLWALRRGGIRSMRTLALGVLEGYRRRGVTELMILATVEAGFRHGIHMSEMGWTLEDNDLINRSLEILGGARIRRFRIYERTIA